MWQPRNILAFSVSFASIKAAPLKSEVLHCDLNAAIDCQLLERPKEERSFETQSLHLSFGLCCGRFADENFPKKYLFRKFVVLHSVDLTQPS